MKRPAAPTGNGISRHPVDLSSQEWGYDRLLKSIPVALDALKGNRKIVLIHTRAIDAFHKAVLLSKEAVAIDHLRLACHALCHALRAGLPKGRDLRIDLNERDPLIVKADERIGEATDAMWCAILDMALILRDIAALDLLKRTDKHALIRAGSPMHHEEFELFHAVLDGSQDCAPLFAALLSRFEHTTGVAPPAPRVGDFNVSFPHHLYLRTVLLRAIVQGDEAAFEAALRAALDYHRKFWGQKKALNPGGSPLAEDPQGFTALHLTALCALAFDKGMDVMVESDYLPRYLYSGAFAGAADGIRGQV